MFLLKNVMTGFVRLLCSPVKFISPERPFKISWPLIDVHRQADWILICFNDWKIATRAHLKSEFLFF